MNQSITAVVTRRLVGGRRADFAAWLSKVVEFLHSVPGYDGITVLSSADKQVHTLIIRFQSHSARVEWESSPRRQALIDAANDFSTANLQLSTGLETFFVAPGALLPPPRWKLCIITVPLVYVLVNLTLFVLDPFTRGWPLVLRLVPVTSLMTLLLTYVALPVATKVFAPWLLSRATPPLTSTTSG